MIATVRNQQRHVIPLTGGGSIEPFEEKSINVSPPWEQSLIAEGALLVLEIVPDLTAPASYHVIRVGVEDPEATLDPDTEYVWFQMDGFGNPIDIKFGRPDA